MISEYATVGYMAKRIQMRKSHFMAIQKIAEQKSKQGLEGHPGDSDHAPKQTVSVASHNFTTSVVTYTQNYLLL